ncbi:hypothetical protein N7467_010264 [Penicillium canescens]|nr:hypothetical protein N7467_010264 [Penicillium canescens]
MWGEIGVWPYGENRSNLSSTINIAYGLTNLALTIHLGLHSAISWTQGGLYVQLALKYWPSTREVLENFMAISADFHGSLFELPCIVPSPLCTPALKQQGSESNLIHALRSDGGDSAYVPTTSPQSDRNASATLHKARNVGVTNTQIQLACPGKPAGSFYLHETMLINPIAYALFVDFDSRRAGKSIPHWFWYCLQPASSSRARPGRCFGHRGHRIGLGVVDTLPYGYIGNAEPPVKPYARS